MKLSVRNGETKSRKPEKKGKMIREEIRIRKIFIRIPESRDKKQNRNIFSDLKDIIFYMEGVNQVHSKINEKNPTLRQTIT